MAARRRVKASGSFQLTGMVVLFGGGCEDVVVERVIWGCGCV